MFKKNFCFELFGITVLRRANASSFICCYLLYDRTAMSDGSVCDWCQQFKNKQIDLLGNPRLLSWSICALGSLHYALSLRPFLNCLHQSRTEPSLITVLPWTAHIRRWILAAQFPSACKKRYHKHYTLRTSQAAGDKIVFSALLRLLLDQYWTKTVETGHWFWDSKCDSSNIELNWKLYFFLWMFKWYHTIFL